MADPQAEGGVAFSGDQPPTEAGYKPPESNIVKNVDITSIATDGDGPSSNDRDYDDPYPGGPNGPPDVALGG